MSLSTASFDKELASLPPPAQPTDPPDGGLSAWLTIAGAWMVQFSTFGQVSSSSFHPPAHSLFSYISAFGVYQGPCPAPSPVSPHPSPDYYETVYLSSQTSSNIRSALCLSSRPPLTPPSWIGSLQLCLMYAPGLFVGRAFDAGYFHHLSIAGALLYVFSIFMLSLAKPDQYYQIFLAQAVGMGLGLGTAFLPSLSIVSHHFRRRRALAIGIVISGASAGGIVFPIMLNRLINSSVGFPNAVRATGAVCGALLLLANCLMRTRLPPKQSAATISWSQMRDVICDGAYLWSIAGAFLTSLGIYVPLFYLQLFAEDHGVDSRITTYCLAILNAGSIAGRLVPTFLADRLGVYNMILPSILACTALIFAIFGATNSAGIILVALLFGFASGAYISLIPSLLVQLCNSMSELGVKMGLAYTVVAVANLTGNPIAGALLGTGRNDATFLMWWRALVFTGVRGWLLAA
ncbi:MFS general substrate transporter [Laetiporus sulphureus 93-53]|uniref:MFS general substrate transporter n=1 Tax=Laetiporus sulphureus 93-53 TaxID=1314785 RepID=A0A165BSK3_9APHY|nr:MFS general substrate transporter [Laetiporus sulphureus 93-53]KZT01573.1 MFS general substrate transporter [Laetiporus sulphureus 93-53]